MCPFFLFLSRQQNNTYHPQTIFARLEMNWSYVLNLREHSMVNWRQRFRLFFFFLFFLSFCSSKKKNAQWKRYSVTNCIPSFFLFYLSPLIRAQNKNKTFKWIAFFLNMLSECELWTLEKTSFFFHLLVSMSVYCCVSLNKKIWRNKIRDTYHKIGYVSSCKWLFLIWEANIKRILYSVGEKCRWNFSFPKGI